MCNTHNGKRYHHIEKRRYAGMQLPHDEVLNAKRDSVNAVKAITSKTVAVIRYDAKLIKWTEGKLKTI